MEDNNETQHKNIVPIHTFYDKSVYSDAWHPHFKLINNTFMNKSKNLKKQVFVWTVNDENIMKELSSYSIDGIITDDVRLVRNSQDDNI